MRRFVISLALTGILASVIFFIEVPLGHRFLPDFYPIPFTLVMTGVWLIGLSFLLLEHENWRFSCAAFAAGMGWLAWWLAATIDQACLSGWFGFLSFACLMSVRAVTTFEVYLVNKRVTHIPKMLLWTIGIFLLVTSFLVYPFSPHNLHARF